MMTFVPILLALLSVQTPEKPEDLHPAFKKSVTSLQKAWDKGEAEAPKLRDPLGQINKFRRGIGQIRVSMLEKETVSWLWCLPPESLIYFTAFDAKKKYRDEAETAKVKSSLIPDQDIYMTSLDFYGLITLQPSWEQGQIARHANPNDLKDVRVVIKVGDRVIQPEEQPGNLLQEEGAGVTSYSTPRYSYSTVNTTSSATAYGNGGYATANGTSQSTIVHRYETIREEGYKWYRGHFSARFSLFDKEGNPILTKKDKEFTVIVIYGASERKATYKLSDLEKPM